MILVVEFPVDAFFLFLVFVLNLVVIVIYFGHVFEILFVVFIKLALARVLIGVVVVVVELFVVVGVSEYVGARVSKHNVVLIVHVKRVVILQAFVLAERAVSVETVCVRRVGKVLLFIWVFLLVALLVLLSLPGVLLRILDFYADFEFVVPALPVDRFVFLFLVFVHYFLLDLVVDLIFKLRILGNIFSGLMSLFTFLT